MSYLLSAAASHTAHAMKMQTFRLLQRPIVFTQALKESIVCRSKSALTQIKFCGAAPSTVVRFNCTRAYDLNTSVTKDVILFKYENPKFYNMLNFFAICQFVFWTYLSHFAFTTLKDAPVDESSLEELSWYQRINLGDNKYRNGLTIICFAIGKFLP